MSSNRLKKCECDTREDLTQYSDAELSLRVFNEEWLYNMRHNTRRFFIEMLEEYFIFNQEQVDELCNDLDEEYANDNHEVY